MISNYSSIQDKVVNSTEEGVRDTLGRRTRNLVKQAKYIKGIDLYKVVIEDILDTDTTFMALEGNKRLLELMIEKGATKTGKYVVRVSRKGTIDLIAGGFNNGSRLKLVTRLGISGMCSALDIECSEVLPYMEYHKPSSTANYRAGKYMRGLMYPEVEHNGAKVIRALIMDMVTEGTSILEVYPTIKAYKEYVATGEMKDESTYSVKTVDGEIKIELVQNDVDSRIKIHSNKSIMSMYSEYCVAGGAVCEQFI